jgi:hypothetical protein
LGNVKCTSFLSLKQYWPSLGPDTESRFIQSLPPALAEVYSNLTPGKMLPIETTVAMNEVFGRFLFPQDPESEQLVKLGVLLANLDLNGIYKLLLKITSVPYAIQQSAVLWQTFHDQGETFIEQPDKNHLFYLIFDYPTMPLKYRIFLSGWIKGLLEICGAKNISITLIGHQAPHVTFDIHWT